MEELVALLKILDAGTGGSGGGGQGSTGSGPKSGGAGNTPVVKEMMEDLEVDGQPGVATELLVAVVELQPLEDAANRCHNSGGWWSWSCK